MPGASFESMLQAQIHSTPVDPPPLTSLSRSGGYVAALASCIAACPATLTPAVMTALDSFDPSKIFVTEGTRRYLGDVPESAAVAHAVAETRLPGGVNVQGAWNDKEIQFVSDSLKIMNDRLPGSSGLLHQVVLRSHLGEDVNQAGNTINEVMGRFGKNLRGRWKFPGLEC